ncbi:MAG: N-acetylmuramoyl-L-alanine amidase [Clostridiales bacterium]|nr:N-acetylmuramoyl-L-alanine amidase [Clostridiales bacterium]
MSRVCFDYGHGGEDPGATYKGRRESDEVLQIGQAVASEIRKHGVTVDETRTGNNTVSLYNRSAYENNNNYDYFVSFHRNAYEPEVANGVEVYTYTNCSNKAKELAKRTLSSLINVGFYNRGVKSANYYVLRATKAPAILIEIGFIDNSNDNRIFDTKRNEIIAALSKAILEQLGIVYSAPNNVVQDNNGAIYRVQVGAYRGKGNAEIMLNRLKNAGFEGYISQ